MHTNEVSTTHSIQHRAKLFCKFARDALQLPTMQPPTMHRSHPFVHLYILKLIKNLFR